MDKVILSHPTGNANVRAAASAMANTQILHSFYTGLACFPESILDKVAEIGPLKEFRKRSFDPSLKPYLHTITFKELGRMISGKLGLKQLIEHENGFFSVDSVYRYQDQCVAKKIKEDKSEDLKGVYAYEDGALESLKAAREKGIMAFYELPIPYWRWFHKIIKEEQLKQPEWASTLTGLKDSAEKLRRKDEELSSADAIIVANSFTARSLSDYPGRINTIKVIPYGFPQVYKKRVYKDRGESVLKLLFVGSLSQQKGVANLLEAVNLLKDKVSLTLVGKKTAEDCGPLNEGLKKHKWIPSLPHHEVLEIMREHDVLVCPSLFEGFGMVITEAMSQGTPVITTERTAGIDLIEDGKNGWLIQAGSTASLVQKLEMILNDSECVKRVGIAAMQTAFQRPWSVYQQELSDTLKELMKNKA